MLLGRADERWFLQVGVTQYFQVVRRLLLLIPLCSACALASWDGFTGAPEESSKDGGTDVSVNADVVVKVEAGADAAPTNLHPFGDAEEGCAQWGQFHAAVTTSTDAHQGTKSCRVCAETNYQGGYTADDRGASGAPKVGKSYRASLWVKTTDASSVQGEVALRTINQQFVETEAKRVQYTITNEWKRVEVTLDVTETAPLLALAVAGNANLDAPCFLFDDIELTESQ